MEIHSIGINYTHPNGVIIDRPNGSGDNLLIIFKTPAEVMINGKLLHVTPDTAIVFGSKSRQYYGNENEYYSNHCIHMLCETDSETVNRAGLKYDCVFSLNNIDKIEELMTDISYEFYSGSENGLETALLLLKVLIFKLGENCRANANTAVSARSVNHEQALRNLRSHIYSNPANDYSVERMAQSLNISPVHFQRLYKKLFKVTSYEDVLLARMDLAKLYLKSTDKSALEISAICGYDCYEHFMRQFKLKTGQTPGAYRRQLPIMPL